MGEVVLDPGALDAFAASSRRRLLAIDTDGYDAALADFAAARNDVGVGDVTSLSGRLADTLGQLERLNRSCEGFVDAMVGLDGQHAEGEVIRTSLSRGDFGAMQRTWQRLSSGDLLSAAEEVEAARRHRLQPGSEGFIGPPHLSSEERAMARAWATSTDIREFLEPMSEAGWNQLVYGGPAVTFGSRPPALQGGPHLETWRESGTMVGGSWGGGGAIRGRDGRLYPLVVPRLLTADGRTWGSDGWGLPPELSVLTMQQQDPTWTTISTEDGVSRFRDDQPTFLDGIVGFAIATNPAFPTIPHTGSLDELGAISINGAGMPRLVVEPRDRPSAPDAGVPAVPEEAEAEPERRFVRDHRGDLRWRDTGQPQSANEREQLGGGGTSAARRAGTTTGGTLDLVTGTATGLVALDNIRRGDHAAYQVVFQEADGNRRRALLRRYDLRFDDSGPLIAASSAWLDEGRLEYEPLAFRPPPFPVMGDRVPPSDGRLLGPDGPQEQR